LQVKNTCKGETASKAEGLCFYLQVKNTCKGEDWWEELTNEDKNRIMESDSQYNQGDFISH
jgi:hypothetical protein